MCPNEARNPGRPSSAALFRPATTEHVMVFALESNGDLNGDGDQNDDRVLHIADADRLRLVNTRLDTFVTVVQGRTLLLTVREIRQREDLNGDGDQADVVLFEYDLDRELATNLGFAWGAPGPEGEDWFTFLADEDGRDDWNGDGDRTDLVLHVREAATGRITNTGLTGLQSSQLAGDFLSTIVSEQQAGQDLNGDGDLYDFVPHVLHLPSGRIVNLKRSWGGWVHTLTPSLLAFDSPEVTEGDLNGDGDALDDVLHLFDPADGILENLGLALELVYIPDSGLFLMFAGAGHLLVFGVPESQQGRDLNGDGDLADRIQHVVDVAPARGRSTAAPWYSWRRKSRVINTRLDVSGRMESIPTVGKTWGVWNVSELREARDLNHDGDMLDLVVHAYHVPSGTLHNLGLSGNWDTWDDLFALRVLESQHGDLNGDGDELDSVIHWIERR